MPGRSRASLPGPRLFWVTPSSASTPASGLTVPGLYTFTVRVSDASHAVTRDVMLNVFAGNQPPVFYEVANRDASMVVQPASSTQPAGLRHGLGERSADLSLERGQPAARSVRVAPELHEQRHSGEVHVRRGRLRLQYRLQGSDAHGLADHYGDGLPGQESSGHLQRCRRAGHHPPWRGCGAGCRHERPRRRYDYPLVDRQERSGGCQTGVRKPRAPRTPP